MAWVKPPLTMAIFQPAARSCSSVALAVGSTVAIYFAPMASSSALVGLMISRRLAKMASIGVPPSMAALVMSSTALKVSGPRRRPQFVDPFDGREVESPVEEEKLRGHEANQKKGRAEGKGGERVRRVWSIEYGVRVRQGSLQPD
jgi:hypothetical protein